MLCRGALANWVFASPGAPQRVVQAMVVRHGVVLALIGVVAGLVAAGALTRMMGSLLFDISPVDPVTHGAVSIGLIGTEAGCQSICLPGAPRTSIRPKLCGLSRAP